MAETVSNHTFLDLIDICDNFRVPKAAVSAGSPSKEQEHLIPWTLSQDPSSPVIGLIRPVILDLLLSENQKIRKQGHQTVWELGNTVDDLATGTRARISFNRSVDTPAKRTAIMKQLCESWRDEGCFPETIGPRKWRNEMYPVYQNPFGTHDDERDGSGNFAFEMERSACGLFGVVTYGVHMSIYEGEGNEIRMWIPTRAKTKQTWPLCLDNSVAGGISSGMGMFDSIVKEAMEEASIAESVTRSHARCVGAVSYFYRTPSGWLQPEVEYIYDLPVPEGVDRKLFQPKPLDGEVEFFELLPLAEVISRMRQGKFKANCAIVVIDFLVRHGFLTPDNEPDFLEINTRLHGRFDYDRW